MDTNPTNINKNDVPSSTSETNTTNATKVTSNEPIHNSIEKIDLVASPEFVNIGSVEVESTASSAEAAEAVAAKEIQDLPLPQPTAFSSGDSAVERKNYKIIIFGCVAGVLLLLLIAVIAVVNSGTN